MTMLDFYKQAHKQSDQTSLHDERVLWIQVLAAIVVRRIQRLQQLVDPVLRPLFRLVSNRDVHGIQIHNFLKPNHDNVRHQIFSVPIATNKFLQGFFLALCIDVPGTDKNGGLS
jgi:hypothetical protein